MPAKNPKSKLFATTVADAQEPSDFMKAYQAGRPLALDLDPRIDLTKPIFAQAQKLQARDRAEKRRESTAA